MTGRYRFEDYRETFREEHVWNINRKVLAENFMESYHLFRLHRRTIGNQSKVEEMDMPPDREGSHARTPAIRHCWNPKRPHRVDESCSESTSGRSRPLQARAATGPAA